MPPDVALHRQAHPATPAAAATTGLLDRLMERAWRAVPADSVAAFRVLFGLLATYGSLRFLARGWVESLYLAPVNHLTYAGFGWVRPLPAPWMHAHMLLLAVLGLCIAAGYRYRVATVAFTLGFAYVELIDATLYLNHYWYVTLTAATLIVLPLHRHRSLDARAGRVTASPTTPAVVLWLLRGQIAVVYLFAGIAKLNGDWLFEALPLRLWLADRAELPLFGPLLALPAVAYAASWAGALFDCTIVGWLSWHRTRPVAYAAVVAFHVLTGLLFRIGIFGAVMIAATLVFFPPDWPQRLFRRACRRAPPTTNGSQSARRPPSGAGELHPARLAPRQPRRRWVLGALAVVALAQVVVPLRHLAYPTNVRWSEEGYYLSWRVMITEKAGYVDFRVRDSGGAEWQVGPDLVLTDWQAAQAVIRPDLLVATAHLIADHYRAAGRGDVEVRADAFVSFNGRRRQRILDPNVDLAAQPRNLAPNAYILPLDPPVHR